MRHGWAWVLTVWMLGLGSLSAQTPPVPDPPREPAPADKTGAADKSTEAAADLTTTIDNVAGYRFWARADSLLWWVRNAPLPVPMVTTGNPNVGFDPNKVTTVNTAGAIGQPGTQVLQGGDSVRFPVSFGLRATVGAWIDEGERIGLEASGFILSQVTNRFAAASDSAGSPPLYFPIFSGIAGAERAVPIADPLRGFSGDVSVTSTLQLWGAESNFVCAFYRNQFMDFSMLAGFRYADLRERLQNHNATTDLLFGNVTVLNDSFRTLNQFYGGQLGGRLDCHSEFFTLEITGKVALGSMHQVVDIQGDITQLGPNPLVPPGLGTFPGGIFAQSTNIGLQNANPTFVPFSVLPSLELKLVCRLTQRLQAFAGYDVIYWSGVLRPGNQINHNVNLSQNAVLDPNGVGTLVGPAQPAFLLNRSDFWAQGVSVGLEFRY
jgi:Putative beta barrel porin-7 (BBP7)